VRAVSGDVLIGIFDNAKGRGVAAECPSCATILREPTEAKVKRKMAAHGERQGHGWTRVTFRRYPGRAAAK
jgi:hypothetical protein